MCSSQVISQNFFNFAFSCNYVIVLAIAHSSYFVQVAFYVVLYLGPVYLTDLIVTGIITPLD